MDRISVDFKGPLPKTAAGYRYLFIAVDEYSRFPFAYACKDMTSSTVIDCLSKLFSLFGCPSYVHSDNQSSFISAEIKNFLVARGIASSHSSPYHPKGNGQCERFVGIIWKSIMLGLHTHNLPVSAWDRVVDGALHSLRSLVNTTMGETPHERLFAYRRKTTSGTSLPSWLSQPGPVLLKKHVRRKDELPVEQVDLIEPANPNFAFIRYPSGREARVSTGNLAKLPPLAAEETLGQEQKAMEQPATPVVPERGISTPQAEPLTSPLDATPETPLTSSPSPASPTEMPVRTVPSQSIPGDVEPGVELGRGHRVKRPRVILDL